MTLMDMFEAALNMPKVSEHGVKSNKGHIPQNVKYFGTWMRKNQPEIFREMYRDWCES